MVNFRLDLKRFQSSNSTNGKKGEDLKVVTNPDLTTDSTPAKDNIIYPTPVINDKAFETKEKGKEEVPSEKKVKDVNNEKNENNVKDVDKDVNNEINGEEVKKKGENNKGEFNNEDR